MDRERGRESPPVPPLPFLSSLVPPPDFIHRERGGGRRGRRRRRLCCLRNKRRRPCILNGISSGAQGGERRRRGNWKTGRRKERTKRRAFGIPPTQSSCRSSTVGGSFPRASFCSDRSSSLGRESSLASLPPSLPSAPSSSGGPGTFLNPLSLLLPPFGDGRKQHFGLPSFPRPHKKRKGEGGSRDRRRKAVL